MYLERVTRSITPPTLLPPTHVGRIRYYIFLKDVLILALGAFGGPQAHMAMLLKYMVCKRKYLTEAELIELNALCQILPGPTSTQTITAIGFKVGGPNLAYLTLLVWIAPAVSIMTIMGLSISYLHQHNIPLNFTRFIQPMAVGFMIYAGYKIGLKVIQNKTSVLLAALAAIITYFLQSPWVTPLILLAGGLVTASQYKKHERLVEKKPLQVQWANFILFLSVAFAAAIIGGITKWLPMRLFENFYRNGSFIFGGGQVLIPLFFTTIWFNSLKAQLPPDSTAISTITAPGFIVLTISSVINTGAFFPITKAVVITRSASATCLETSSFCFCK